MPTRKCDHDWNVFLRVSNQLLITNVYFFTLAKIRAICSAVIVVICWWSIFSAKFHFLNVRITYVDSVIDVLILNIILISQKIGIKHKRIILHTYKQLKLKKKLV